MTRYETHPATATRETSNRHLSQKEILTGASFYIFNLILVVLFPTILSCLYHLDTSDYNFKNLILIILMVSFLVALIFPWVFWFLKRTQSTFVTEVGKAYLNFYLTYLIWNIVFMIVGISIIVLGAEIYDQDFVPFIILVGIFTPFILFIDASIFFSFSIAGLIMTLLGKVPKFPLLFKFFKYKE